jgi:membrane protein implicated in regulation of membrane protease activity
MQDAANFVFAHPFWGWLALGAVLLAAELATGSGWLLWPAACAGLVALLTAFVPISTPIAVVIFAVLTIVTTIISRRMIGPPPPHSDLNDPLGRIVGHHGTAVSAFVNGAGRVFVDGKEWAAQAEPDATPSPEQRIEVTGVEGTILRVRGLLA